MLWMLGIVEMYIKDIEKYKLFKEYNCCYNRPFDDQTQERIHLESEAIFTEEMV